MDENLLENINYNYEEEIKSLNIKLFHLHDELAEANATIRQLEWQIQSLEERLGGLEW